MKRLEDLGAASYKRLPGKGLRNSGLVAVFRTRCTLWMAGDHILSIDNNVFTEDYKRFYFNDIRAIIIQKSSKRLVRNIVFSIFAAVFALIAYFSGDIARSIFFIISALFVLCIFINTVRGPTCTGTLLTEVHREVLPSLNRIRIATKVCNILETKIEKAQGGRLTRDMLMKEELSRVANQNQDESRYDTKRHPNTVQTSPYKGMIHLVVFILVVINGLFTGFELLHHTLTINIIQSFIILLFTTGVIISLVKQSSTDMPKALKTITWCILGYVCLSYVSSQIVMISTMMKNTSAFMNQWNMYRAIWDISPYDSLFMFVYNLISMTLSLLLGSAGLILTNRFRAQGNIQVHNRQQGD